MPFDTLGQCDQRIESFGLDDMDYNTAWLPDTSLLHRSSKPEQIIFSPHACTLFSNNPNENSLMDYRPWMTDDQGDDDMSQQSSCGSPLTDPIPPLETLHAALSRFRLSFTETGINMEANISTASDLRSLLDAFSKLSCTPAFNNQHPHDPPRRNSVVLYRNKSCKSSPVNHIQQVGLLGRMIAPHPSHDGLLTLRQIADKCVDTYFSCWVRYPPVLRRHDFMAWYIAQPAPQETLIVNALCSLVFRHTVTHHCTAGLQPFLADPDRLHQQEEFFFARARGALAQALDDDPPERFTVIALTFLCVRTEPSRRHHYGGLAVSLLQQLAIYPRMVDEDDDDDYGLELDTRLWWYVWQIDFFHWTAGYPKITPLLQHPNQRYDHVDLPRLYDQDTDETQLSILAQAHTLSLWRLQADIISTMYEQEAELTSEQLLAFDDRLRALDQQWKAPLGSPDVDLARTRIGLEHNATLIILHQLFTPEPGTPPSPSGLASLQICIDAALEQLDLLAGCISSPTRCAFDLFELRRVGQVLAMATHDREVLDRQLERALNVLAATPEGKIGTKGWTEVAEFLLAQRPPRKKKSTKKQRAATEISVQQRLGQKPLTGLSSSLSIISFPHHQNPPPPPRPTQTFVQATCNTFDGGTNQPRFRYFNPRKMNKFLFIDESR